MKSNRLLKAVILLGMFTMSTVLLLSGTLARFTAEFDGQGTMRAGIWAPRVTPSRAEKPPWLSFWYRLAAPSANSTQETMAQPAAVGSEEDHERLFMFFKDPGDSYYFEFELDNKSEVSAWYHLRAVLPAGPGESKGTLPVMTVSCGCTGGTHTVSGNSVLVPYQDACTAIVSLTPGAPDANGHQSFTGLQILADVEQID